MLRKNKDHLDFRILIQFQKDLLEIVFPFSSLLLQHIFFEK